MPKYLLQASYTSAGAKGLLKEGGTARLEASRNTVSKMGGEIESYHYAFGGTTSTSSSTCRTTPPFAATGAVRTKTVTLLTPAELDEAGEKQVSYQPPAG
jgi:uncharacterized protein with GYD domain